MRAFRLTLGLALAVALVAQPRPGVARAACDASGADLDAVAAARRAVEAACACDGFTSHRLYVDCARDVIAAEVGADRGHERGFCGR
jgi:hypothetical protein